MAGYEHALFLLLLLGYLLRDLPGKNPASLYLITGGLLLALLPPFTSIVVPWNFILALVLPWIFWNNAQSLLRIERRPLWREVFLWLITALSLTLIVDFIGTLPWLRAIFFGIVASSIMWQAAGHERVASPLGNIGPLALVFLLVETSLVLDAPRRYLGNFFSGASLGIAFALISITVMKRVPLKHENRISLGQVYLAYWTALVIGTSAITAALISAIVFAEFNKRRSDIEGSITGSALLDERLTFFVALALFIFAAWQTHQPVALIQWLEVGLGLIIGLLITLLGRRIGLPQFEHPNSVWYFTLKLGMFLLGALILWPRGPELGPVIIWIALGSAIFLPVFSAIVLKALRNLNMQWNADNPDAY